MIQMFTGVPGSGKSCRASAEILRMLKGGKYVLANFDYDASPWDDLFIRVPDYPTAEHIYGILRDLPLKSKEHSYCLIIDEAQRCFNSRSWSERGRSAWLKFFSLSRHLSCDVILIAQQAQMVDKQIRACVQTEVRHMRVSAMGSVPFVISGFGLLPLCFWVESYFGTRIKVASGFFLPRKKYWERYDSYDLTFVDDLGLASV